MTSIYLDIHQVALIELTILKIWLFKWSKTSLFIMLNLDHKLIFIKDITIWHWCLDHKNLKSISFFYGMITL